MAESRATSRATSRRSLATQTAVVTTLVAALTALVTFAVSARLIHGAADRQARVELGRYADLVADSAGAQSIGARQLTAGVRALAKLADVTPVRVRADGTVVPVAPVSAPAIAKRSARVAAALPEAVVTAAARGTPVDVTRSVAGTLYFVEARPLPSGDGSIVLVQPRTSSAGLNGTLRGRLLIALAAGLVIAAALGAFLAQRLARPLAAVATGAWQLTHGRRDVRVDPDGPREVAEVAESINTLATALGTSERRQREFLLSVSHELRTPLTAITGYAEALADGVVPREGTAEVGATVLGEAHRLERLVHDLLDLARLGAADFHIDVGTVDVGVLVRTAGEVWRTRCEREGVPVTVDVPEFPLLLQTDATRVRQIIDGLAENALRVTPRGAPIVLGVRPFPDGGAEIEVRDGGPGLTDDDLEVAFDRSALYDRYRGIRRVGTGVGLALIAGLAARLGGTPSAGHAPEGGARFAVRLPAVPPPTFTQR